MPQPFNVWRHPIKDILCALFGKPPCAAFRDIRLSAELIKECEAFGIGFVSKKLLCKRLAVRRVAAIAVDGFWAELMQFEHNFALRIAIASDSVSEASNSQFVLMDRRPEVGVSIDLDKVEDDAV